MLNRQTISLVVAFVASGSIHPILVQLAAFNGAAEPSTMLVLLPSCLGMSLSILFNLSAVGKGDIDWKSILLLSFLDLVSARITLQGMIAAGSTIYTIVNCSMTLFTALFSVLLLKRHLGVVEWVGIGIVTIGLCILGIGCQHEAPGVSYGVVLILIGCFIHAFSYIVVEYMLVHSDNPVAPEVLCAILGMCGVSFNLAWQVFFTLPRYDELVTQEIRAHDGHLDTILFTYIALMIATSINATCFYNLMGKVGSASTGVLKGLQAVSTFVTSHCAFCSTQQAQCFTPLKGVSLTLVLAGVLIYSAAVDRAAKSVAAMDAVGAAAGAANAVQGREAEGYQLVGDLCLDTEQCVFETTKLSGSYQTDVDDDVLV